MPKVEKPVKPWQKFLVGTQVAMHSRCGYTFGKVVRIEGQQIEVKVFELDFTSRNPYGDSKVMCTFGRPSQQKNKIFNWSITRKRHICKATDEDACLYEPTANYVEHARLD